jgi:hypothetical protein
MQFISSLTIAVLLATSVTSACGTRTGFAVAGGTMLTGIIVANAVNNENYNTENAFRPTNEIVGTLMVFTAIAMLVGNVVAHARQTPTSKPPLRPAVAPNFAAPGRQITNELRALTKLALQAARDNLCADARQLAIRASVLDAAYVEATVVNDPAMVRCTHNLATAGEP